MVNNQGTVKGRRGGSDDEKRVEGGEALRSTSKVKAWEGPCCAVHHLAQLRCSAPAQAQALATACGSAIRTTCRPNASNRRADHAGGLHCTTPWLVACPARFPMRHWLAQHSAGWPCVQDHDHARPRPCTHLNPSTAPATYRPSTRPRGHVHLSSSADKSARKPRRSAA